MQNKKRLSQFMSRILRHQPEIIGISIEKNGAWADVNQLIQGINRSGKYHIDKALLEEIVRDDEKQRYRFSPDETKIRANQGHSIDVVIPMEQKAPPEWLYHGTAEHHVESIREKGLLPGNRLFVHLSKDAETALKVGRRHGKPVVLKIAAGEMYKQGYSFYISDNGIWQIKTVPVNFIVFP